MKISSFLFAFLLCCVFISCDDDDPEVPNEEELITVLNYVLTPMNGGTPVTLNFTDMDGDGGNDPVITGGTLAQNTTYSGQMDLLGVDESITEEIEEEDDEHQFFFNTNNLSGINIQYDDQDDNGNPVGLKTTLTTTGASTGTLTVILRHQPDKDASGVSDGVIDNAGGETDIEVTFDIDVQ